MDRLDAMATLLAAIDAGSLSAASRRLGVPLATVSRKVAALETALGTRLLVRTSRGLAPTEAGRDYAAACRRAIEAIGEAERAARGEYQAPRGELVMTAPIVFGRLHVLPVVTEFLAAYPEITLRLMLADRNANLPEEHIDVALRIGALPDSTMRAMRLGEIRRVVCASPGYLAARGVPAVPEDLTQHDCVTFDVLMDRGVWMFPSGPIAVRARLTVNTAEAAIDAAIAGLGITRVLSYQVAEAIRDGRLVPLLEGHAPPPVPVNLLTLGQATPPRKLRAFLDFAGPRLRGRVGEGGRK